MVFDGDGDTGLMGSLMWCLWERRKT